jgi:hypothetical protein
VLARQVGEVRFESPPRLVEVFGHHAHVGEHRHEIRVARPPGHHVQVQMLGDAGAGRGPEVHAHVERARANGPSQPGDALAA